MTSPTSAPTDKKKPSRFQIQSIFDFLNSPLVVGFTLTILCTLVAYNFYQVRGMQESARRQLPSIRKNMFEFIEWMDLKNQDIRLRFFLKERAPAPEAALLAIDDRSIDEIGRWPWSREKIAFVVDELMKYGASSVGFDIVFSEPQVDQTMEAIKRIESKGNSAIPENIKTILDEEKQRAQPDATLAASLNKQKEKIVLGGFNEDSSDSRHLPYQDYCRNEAFKRSRSGKLIKLNTTFVVNDASNLFEDLEFDSVFEQLFPKIEEANTAVFLKSVFNKPNLASLNEMQNRQLQNLLESANMDYCNNWLTDKDHDAESLKEPYQIILAKSKILADLPYEQALKKFKDSTKPLPIRQHERWTLNTPLIQDSADFTGAFNAEQDSDGTIRRTSLLFRTGNRLGLSYIPSIALQSYLLATGYRADVELDVDPEHTDQKIFTKFDIMDPSKNPEELVSRIPVDSQGRMVINYAGGTNTYPYLPAKELFNGKETAEISQSEWKPSERAWGIRVHEVNKADFIKGKSFIFGATAIGVYDLRVTPFEKNFPGPETHVNTLGNLFQKNFLKPPAKEQNYMIGAIFILGIVLTLAISQTTAIPGFLITLFSFALAGGVDQYLSKKGYIATMVLPGSVIFVLYTILFFYKYLTEERKKKALRSTFSKYVSPAVVDEILRDPENIELGGKKQRMTVFFSDLRNFTTISEKLQATELSDVLNLYLTPMTQLVFANKGTLDKYIGDAVMAFFGAPISFPDHAKHACRCAIASYKKLVDIRNEIDAKFPGKNIPIDIGIGVNTADVSVGNMGSDIVRSYTVMGDGVNLASRLEGITKEYGVKIVISQFTYEEVKDDFTCRELDWVRVKGKVEPVRIFELICEGRPDQTTSDMIQHFTAGFDHYHKKDFHAALAEFRSVLNLVPNDPPAELYVERCEEYVQTPPPENWDGVFVMKTK